VTIQTCQWPDAVPEKIWEDLSSAMHSEKTILNSRTSPENLAQSYRQGLAIVKLLRDDVVGFISAWPVAGGFIELGSAWVRKDMRGQGIGNDLYKEAKQLHGIQEDICFAITQNPFALKAGFHAGLIQNGNWNDPVPWELTCGPCDVVLDAEKLSCPRRSTTCWLRIMQR